MGYEILLKERFEFSTKKHSYAYDPEGYTRLVEDLPTVLEVDDRTIGFNDTPGISEGCYFFVCGCDDYAKRKRDYESGISYKRFANDPDFDWDCIATCGHIALARRYFARPLANKVIGDIYAREARPFTKLFGSREYSLLNALNPRLTSSLMGHYQDLREAGSSKVHRT